jgi:guanylate kinase
VSTAPPASREPLLIVVAAPSGGGKSTVLRAVFREIPGLMFSVSHTTRRARPGEEDGREYHFVTEPEFRQLVAEGAFLEWAEVHSRLYGTSRSELARARAAGCDLVLDIDVQGAEQVVRAHPESLTIFLMPPSIEVLEDRLRSRASESSEALAIRLSNARREMARAGEFRHVVVNDRLEDTIGRTVDIIRAARAARAAGAPAPLGVDGR